jgi:hypothetical protein
VFASSEGKPAEEPDNSLGGHHGRVSAVEIVFLSHRGSYCPLRIGCCRGDESEEGAMPKRMFQTPDGTGTSAGRIIYFIVTLVGATALVAGLIIAFYEVFAKTGTTTGKDIVVAGLGGLLGGAGGKAVQASVGK